jgi:hypothetical protein
VLLIEKYVYREIKENEVNYLIELLASALAILNDLRQYQLNSTVDNSLYGLKNRSAITN